MVVFTDSHDISWFQYLHGHSLLGTYIRWIIVDIPLMYLMDKDNLKRTIEKFVIKHGTSSQKHTSKYKAQFKTKVVRLTTLAVPAVKQKNLHWSGNRWDKNKVLYYTSAGYALYLSTLLCYLGCVYRVANKFCPTNDSWPLVKHTSKNMFNNAPFIFQQDGAPVHTANISQIWLRENIPGFITKEQ